VPGAYPFDAELDTDEGWAKETRSYWLRDWPGYVEFFFAMCLTEPHSTKPIEDCVGWAMDTDMETILTGLRGWETKIIGPTEVAELIKQVRCPVLVIHGTDDAQVDSWRGEELAQQLQGELVLLEGSGHAPHVRDPVKVNALLRDFIEPAPPPQRWAEVTSQAGSVHIVADWTRACATRRGGRGRATEVAS
jgi:pimeloyl-ACP methyl ester carboxylesterase